MTTGARVRQVRELRGLTQQQLADATEVTQPRIRQIESDMRPASPAWLARASAATSYPVEFFHQPLAGSEGFPLGSMLFWAQASMSKRERVQAHRHGQVLYEITERLARRFPPVVPRLPELDASADAAEAADVTRAALGLTPDQPVPNLTRTLENNGALVLSVPLSNPHHEAYSLWAGWRPARPVVVLLGIDHGDRQRWALAHELGHLVLHRVPPADRRVGEEEAHRFARELLLPRDAFHDELPETVTLASLAPLKPRWGVSVQVLVRRARDLDCISDRQYRYLYQQMSARGWRTRDVGEPDHLAVPLEKPRVLMKMIEKLYGPVVDYTAVAKELRVPVFELQDLLRRQAGAPRARSTTASPDAQVLNLDQLRATKTRSQAAERAVAD